MAFERDPHRLYPHDRLMARTVLPFVPKAVTPNSVTILRMVLTPLGLYFLFLENFAIGIPFFLFLAFTDALDGSIARVRKQVTDWGTFYDPVADKLLIGSVVLLVVAKHVSLTFALAIIGLEALIVSGGVLRKRKGRTASANVFGKAKMFFQVAGVTLLLISVAFGSAPLAAVSVGTLSVSIVLAVVSLVTYGM